LRLRHAVPGLVCLYLLIHTELPKGMQVYEEYLIKNLPELFGGDVR